MKTPSPIRLQFNRLEDMSFDEQVKAGRALFLSKPVNPRLEQALSVSQSPAHWNRWVMDMGTGRMIEVGK